MTHTLHRTGSVESFEDDYIVTMLCERGINDFETVPKFRRFCEMALGHGAVKIGAPDYGNEYKQWGVDKLLDSLSDRVKLIHVIFRDDDAVIRFLHAVKEADFGLSIVVTGVFDKVADICRSVGLERNSINQSLGFWGRTDKLPPPEILEINTMCGHGMVTVSLIQDVIKDIKEGSCTQEEGAERLFLPCS
jgi:hypothetical protein